MQSNLNANSSLKITLLSNLFSRLTLASELAQVLATLIYKLTKEMPMTLFAISDLANG
jgi:hypothetical protein